MMSRVTSIVVRPAAGASVRAAISTLEITVASSFAHWVAGGMLPSMGWIAASAVPIFAAGLLLHRGGLRLSTALVGAVAGQVFLHLALVSGTSAEHLHTAGSAPSMTGPMLTGPMLTGPMLVAHAVGVLATLLVWTIRRRVWDVLVRLDRVRPHRFLRPVRRPIGARAAIDAWLQWMASRRRGPPGWVGV